MNVNEERRYSGRLEDFIEMAKTGKRVEMEVELNKLPMIQEIHTGKAHDLSDKKNTYLLIAYYTFKMDDQIHRLSKVYMFATEDESLNSLRVNKNIANVRLQVDYNRLRIAHVHFKEKYF